VESFVGATYLRKANASALRFNRLDQNSHVEEEGRSFLGFDF